MGDVEAAVIKAPTVASPPTPPGNDDQQVFGDDSQPATKEASTDVGNGEDDDEEPAVIQAPASVKISVVSTADNARENKKFGRWLKKKFGRGPKHEATLY